MKYQTHTTRTQGTTMNKSEALEMIEEISKIHEEYMQKVERILKKVEELKK